MKLANYDAYGCVGWRGSVCVEGGRALGLVYDAVAAQTWKRFCVGWAI